MVLFMVMDISVGHLVADVSAYHMRIIRIAKAKKTLEYMRICRISMRMEKHPHGQH